MALADSVSRRQIFWLLIALIAIPTIVLASYSFTGVMDRRAAAEQRLRERYLYQAASLELGVLTRLAAEDERLRATLADLPAAALQPALSRLLETDRLLRHAWLSTDPSIPPALAATIPGRLQDLSDAAPLTFLTLDPLTPGSPYGTSTIALSRIAPACIVIYEFDPAAIDALILPELITRQFSTEQATYRLRPRVTGISTPISFDRLRQDLLQQVGEDRPLVDHPLAPPFASWRITISPTADPALSGPRTGWVLFFTALSGVGIWLMARAIAQQVALARLQTDFLSNVSHELRTPLTSIRMFIETLQSGRVKDPEKVRECLDIIAQESERLSGKIERVLSWARMEAGRRRYEFELLRPVDAVKEVLDAFRAQQLGGGAPIIVQVPPELPLIRIDRDAFGEAMLNLLSNARKYGGEHVQIRIEARADRRFVAISVADDGPGIPKNELKRIFEKFYRPKILLSESTQGSGLGLAIVRSVIEAHRGRIEVESEEGRGARFIMKFQRI